MKTVKELAKNYHVLLRMLMEQRDDLSDVEEKAFSAMLLRMDEAERKGVPLVLSFKQKAWINDVVKRLDIVEPAANLVSRGLVPRGAEVETPYVLRNLPLKPPGMT